jgi:hypothetical protein
MQVKKFEKLNLSKFDAFKQNELTNLCAIEGGSFPGETGTWSSGKADTDQIGNSRPPTGVSYIANDGFK